MSKEIIIGASPETAPETAPETPQEVVATPKRRGRPPGGGTPRTAKAPRAEKAANGHGKMSLTLSMKYEGGGSGTINMGRQVTDFASNPIEATKAMIKYLDEWTAGMRG